MMRALRPFGTASLTMTPGEWNLIRAVFFSFKEPKALQN